MKVANVLQALGTSIGTSKPSPTELGYIAQGYQLPHGFTWEQVHIERAYWGSPEDMVPLATAPSVVAWGIPYANNAAMLRYEHTDSLCRAPNTLIDSMPSRCSLPAGHEGKHRRSDGRAEWHCVCRSSPCPHRPA